VKRCEGHARNRTKEAAKATRNQKKSAGNLPKFTWKSMMNQRQQDLEYYFFDNPYDFVFQ